MPSLWVSILAFFLVAATAFGQDDASGMTMSVAEQLDRIATNHGIIIEGIALTEAAYLRPIHGRPLARIQRLLSDYNYVLTQDIDGTIERVVILNRKRGGPLPIILQTSRRGNHHLVRGTIGGNGQERMDVSLLIDTGADFVVLPESMMEALNLDPDIYEVRTIQTANGKVDALFGLLPFLQLGAETLEDIDVAFIEDNRLGGASLLGMSVLGRYRMTIDDELQRITLIKSR